MGLCVWKEQDPNDSISLSEKVLGKDELGASLIRKSSYGGI